MEEAIHSFWNALKPNGKAILVLGRESNVRGIPFYNGQLIIELLEKSGGFLNIKTLERKFINKFGTNIKEDIIIAEKSLNTSPTFDNSRKVALKHLAENLSLAKGEIALDIEDAIRNINRIQSSPILNPTNIIIHE